MKTDKQLLVESLTQMGLNDQVGYESKKNKDIVWIDDLSGTVMNFKFDKNGKFIKLKTSEY